MSATSIDRFSKALQSQSSRDELRSIFPKDGDPQDAALAQFLAGSLSTLTPTDAIADIGCGHAILAVAIKHVAKTAQLPRYLAIDQHQFLNSIAMPVEVHNNSEKIAYRDFISLRSPRPDIKLAVLRNLLHELDILETSELLIGLCSALLPGTPIFIQDMENLPRVEPRFAGWNATLLTEVLKTLLFEPVQYSLDSHSGNRWFAMTGSIPKTPPTKETALALLRDARSKQVDLMYQRMHELKRTWSEDKESEFRVLSLEYGSLNVQLGAVSDSLHDQGSAIEGRGEKIPLRPAPGALGVSFENHRGKPVDQCGVLGVVFNKDNVDIPAMIRGAQQEVWFWGYSLAPMFKYGDNKEALRSALERGVTVQLLLADPGSLAVRSRSEQSVYSTSKPLAAQILATLEDAKRFASEIGASRLQVRTCDIIPPCSSFGVDNVAVFSLYSPSLRGRVAPCFVLAETAEPKLSHYSVLKADFREAFDAAQDVLEAHHV